MAERKLLLLSSEFPPGPGGIGQHAWQLASHLAALGWSIHVAAPQPYVTEEQRASFNQAQPFQVFTLTDQGSRPALTWARVQQIRRLVAAVDPALIVGSGQRSLWLAAALSALRRRPWLAVGHGTEFLSPSRLSQALTRRALCSATAVVTVSNYTAGLVRRLQVAPRRLAVIPNGAGGDRFSPQPADELRQRLGLEGARVLLTVGHVSPRKAQDVVIHALPEILRHVSNLVYLVVGLPTHQPEYERLAQELGVGDHVRFAGVVPEADLPAYYNLADLFVLVSRSTSGGDVEGYGIVVLEAALCGKPAVVSRTGGLAEAVRDGETGLVVPAEDPAATAGAVVKLLQNESLFACLSQGALRRAQQMTWAQQARRYHDLLQELLVPC